MVARVSAFILIWMDMSIFRFNTTTKIQSLQRKLTKKQPSRAHTDENHTEPFIVYEIEFKRLWYMYLHTSTNPKWHIHSCVLFSGTQLIVIKQWIWKTTDDDVRTETCELNFQNAVNTTTAPATVQFIKVCDRTQFFLIVIQLWTPEPIVCVCSILKTTFFASLFVIVFVVVVVAWTNYSLN